jgi:hypothetical protein
MIQPTLLYNKDLDQMWRQVLNRETGQLSLADEDFIDFFLRRLRGTPSLPPPGLPRAEFLFYLLAQIGRRRPALFPTLDLCLAMFNLLAARHHGLAVDRLVCLDFGLLPVAVLASGLGARVAPPPASTHKNWPGLLFPALRTDDRNLAGALVLGRDPLKLTNDDPELPGKLAEASGGLFFCFWDFLGVNLHNHARKKWLKEAPIRSIIQLPRPRRQSVAYYPALLETGPVRPGLIRLADVRDTAPGPGGLAQAEVLKAVLGAPGNEQSLEVAPEALLQLNRSDFTPRRYLVKRLDPREAPLSAYAYLIRCQLPRAKLTPEELKALKPGREALSPDNGYFLCREITLPNLDERTGFLLPGAGQMVRVAPSNSPGRDKENILQEHDILISFRGTEANIGQVGLVDGPPREPMISGQSLCVIRVVKDSLDPVWLYYYLRRAETRRLVLSHSSGSSMLTVNTGDLANLPIPDPNSSQVRACHDRHDRIRGLMDDIRELYGQVHEEKQALDRDWLEFGRSAPGPDKGIAKLPSGKFII